jgi:hypothetical protein
MVCSVKKMSDTQIDKEYQEELKLVRAIRAELEIKKLAREREYEIGIHCFMTTFKIVLVLLVILFLIYVWHIATMIFSLCHAYTIITAGMILLS